MILILSQSELESTTEDVMDWLRLEGVPHRRINGDDIGNNEDLSLVISSSADDKLEFDTAAPFDLEGVSTVWFRRWYMTRRYRDAHLIHSEAGERAVRVTTSVLERQADDELQTISGHVFYNLRHTRTLGLTRTRLNKLNTLSLAKSCGLRIPATLVTSNKNELLRFREIYPELITKPLGEATFYDIDDNSFGTYTSILSDALIEALPRVFFPALFQEKLNKQYELRVFVLDGRCYAMAIFSQANRQTELDFRRYDNERPNRSVPYRLPANIETAILRCMAELKLDTGSLDLIRTTCGQYVFLEVNPAGQFGMVSQPCNYYLEREVARALIARERSMVGVLYE